MSKWFYEPVGPNGGLVGQSVPDILGGSKLTAEASLAREAIQNSVDARADDRIVAVDFRTVCLKGADKRAFFDASGLAEMAGREQIDHLLPNRDDDVLSLDDDTVVLTYIEDFGTKGLAGDAADPKCGLRKLLLDLGGSDKGLSGEASGGSYGFGKSVYSANSRVRAVIVHSRTLDGNEKPVDRLMGCAYQHNVEDAGLTGRAFFGLQEPTDVGVERQMPFEGEAAVVLAEKLGFEPRGDDDFGTSILLLDSTVNSEELRIGVEDWWWPRLVDRDLEISILDADGVEHTPKPKSRPDLQPFIEAYAIAEGRTPEPTGEEARKEARFFPPGKKIEGLITGKLGIVVAQTRLEEDDEFAGGARHVAEPCSVALLRAPRMVVAYHKAWWPFVPTVAGVFVADGSEATNDVLKRSEPPEHDYWKQTRSPRLNESEARFVKGLLTAIKRNVAKFRKEAVPPPDPETNSTSKLERLLSAALGMGPKKKPTSPGRSESPISIHTESGPRVFAAEGGLVVEGVYSFALGHPEEDKPETVQLKLECFSVGEDGTTADEIALTVKDASGDVRDGIITVTLSGDDRKSLTYRSAVYPDDWSVQLEPSATIMETAT